MSISRQGNFLGQMRVDVLHLRSIDSSVANDFDLLVGKILSGKKPLVIKGFTIATSGTLGTAADSLVLNVADSIIAHFNASEAGTIFATSSADSQEILSANNPKVEGSFSASSFNYIGLDLLRSADETTSDIVQFLDVTTKLEAGQDIPLGRILQFKITISTQNFASTENVLPIAIIKTDSSNNVESITDARKMMFRLGAGGDVPNATSSYGWGARTDNSIIYDALNTSNPFVGEDKGIYDLKSWMDAVTTSIWETKGGSRWFSPQNRDNVKLAYGPLVIGLNGDNFLFTGPSTLQWQDLRLVFENSATGIYYNTITNGSVSDFVDGYCLYVDIDRDSNATNLTPLAKPLTEVGSSSIPGRRIILAWKVNGEIYTRDRAYEVGRAYSAATISALGLSRISRDYVSLTEAVGGVSNDPIAISEKGGTIVAPTTSGLYGLKATGDGSGIGLWGVSVANVGTKGQSASNTGIWGISTSGIGVHGESNSNKGIYGFSPTFIGIHGESTSNTGVHGLSSTGIGMHGISTSSYGVIGASTSYWGIRGESVSGGGIEGIGGGTGVGVKGAGGLSGGVGVWGIGGTDAVDGGTGVWGSGGVGSSGIPGRGVYGIAANAAATDTEGGYGIVGQGGQAIGASPGSFVRSGYGIVGYGGISSNPRVTGGNGVYGLGRSGWNSDNTSSLPPTSGGAGAEFYGGDGGNWLSTVALGAGGPGGPTHSGAVFVKAGNGGRGKDTDTGTASTGGASEAAVYGIAGRGGSGGNGFVSGNGGLGGLGGVGGIFSGGAGGSGGTGNPSGIQGAGGAGREGVYAVGGPGGPHGFFGTASPNGSPGIGVHGVGASDQLVVFYNSRTSVPFAIDGTVTNNGQTATVVYDSNPSGYINDGHLIIKNPTGNFASGAIFGAGSSGVIIGNYEALGGSGIGVKGAGGAPNGIGGSFSASGTGNGLETFATSGYALVANASNGIAVVSVTNSGIGGAGVSSIGASAGRGGQFYGGARTSGQGAGGGGTGVYGIGGDSIFIGVGSRVGGRGGEFIGGTGTNLGGYGLFANGGTSTSLVGQYGIYAKGGGTGADGAAAIYAEGTNTTGEAVVTNGHIVVPPDKFYKYSTAKTRHVHIPLYNVITFNQSGFLENPIYPWPVIVNNNRALLAMNGVENAYVYFPLHIPVGSIISTVDLMKFAAATPQHDIYVIRTDGTASAAFTIGITSSYSNTTLNSWQTALTLTSDNTVLDNFGYYIVIHWVSGTSTFSGVRVTYTYQQEDVNC